MAALTLRARRRPEQVQQTALFDHFIGNYKQAIWKFNPERYRGREIYSEIEFGRLLHQDISCLALFLEDWSANKGSVGLWVARPKADAQP